MIKNRRKNGAAILGIFIFLAISGADFCHSEKTPVDNDQCPVCHLQKSTGSTEYISTFQPDKPDFCCRLVEEKNKEHIFIIDRAIKSRDPPAFFSL